MPLDVDMRFPFQLQLPVLSRRAWQVCLCLALSLGLLLSGLPWMPTALAGREDDNYDGNIFALYAGNGSLVPPRVSLAQSIQYKKPALVFIYVDDSMDCKQYAPVISQLQAPYGRAASFIPIMADAIPDQESYESLEPGYYFDGVVPQTLVFDQSGKVRFDQAGAIAYEEIDDVLREVFDLLPRSESVELRRRTLNEVTTELVPEG